MLSASTRLLQLLSLLQTRPHWEGAELARALSVHPRTLRRDVDRLRQIGYPVHSSSGVAGGYALRGGSELPPLVLDDDEALAVTIALRLATAGAVGGIEEPALRALVKLEQVMPQRLQRRADALREAILPMARNGPSVDAQRLAELACACRDQSRVAFDYGDRLGRASTREVEPQAVVHFESRWYLVAWDPLRSDWRTFRIDRIAGPCTIGAHFRPRRPPARGNLRRFIAESVAVAPYTAQARVVLHAPQPEMARRIPANAALLEPLDEGRCLLRCGAHALDHLAGWLLALDVAFEVIEPPALLERLRAAQRRLEQSLP